MSAKLDSDFADDPMGLSRPRRAHWTTSFLYWVFGLFATVLGGQLVLSGAMEGYCIVWPSIGTRFAPGYSEASYNRIQPGMTKPEVLDLLGEPLGKSVATRRQEWGNRNPGDESWQYSSDSSARGGDWAWLSREVIFRDEKVLRLWPWVYYD